MQNRFTILRSGYDTVEMAYSAALPDAFLEAVDVGKVQATKARRPQHATFNGAHFLIEPSGGQGGYAYRVSTGPFGGDWKFRERSSRDPWTTHVKLRAHGLATKGLIQAKQECDDFLRRIGSSFDPANARVARADFAIDVFFPGFVAQASEFVCHARMGKSENIERQSRGDVCDYLRIGKMPGKQLCLYDKSKKTMRDGDLVWIDIFQNQLARKFVNFDRAAPLRDIWRFELRAGRDFITERIGLRRWDKFISNRREIFLSLAKAISWRIPSNDTNRTRWALHPLWQTIGNTIESDTGVSQACSIAPGTLRRLRDEQVAGLDAQLVGLTLTRAAFESIAAAGITKFALLLMQKTGAVLEMRPDLEEELLKRRERIEFQYGCTLAHPASALVSTRLHAEP